MLETLLVGTGSVVLAEIGDKTQLLAFILAARFKKPVPIVLGIFFATIFNHSLAGALGSWVSTSLSPDTLKWILAVSFFCMAAWMLIPDKEDGNALDAAWMQRFGVFTTTLIAFFLAEMGDKTQIATVALAAHYDSAVLVVAATTLGMLIADVPAVWLGDKFCERIPMKLVHTAAALLFIALGIAAFWV